MSQRDERRRQLSQNFLVSRSVVNNLIREAAPISDETVLDIGAGRGIITEACLARGARVIAIESDPNWASMLRDRYGRDSSVRVVQADFASVEIPGTEPLTAISNLPFGSTTAILRHLLTHSIGRMRAASLLLQDEVAKKRSGIFGNNLFNVQWYPWYEFHYVRRVGRKAFRPVPAVDAGQLRIVPRSEPLLPPEQMTAFQHFARRGYTGEGRKRGAPLPTVGHGTSSDRWVSEFLRYRQR